MRPSQSTVMKANWRIDDFVGDRQVEAVAVADGGPVADARAAERIHSELQAGGLDGVHVHDAGEIAT